MIRIVTLFLLLILYCSLAHTQEKPVTGEQSLLSGLMSATSTTIGGYGNSYYQHDGNSGSAHVNMERFVLFIGHRFNAGVSLFSEIEVEDAKVAGGEEGGEIALEQAYLKFDLSRNTHLVAGLFLPRLGILNESHLPPSFNGNERTTVETLVIPATWRELGLGLYGKLEALPLSYSFALVNGLTAAGFEHGTGIRGGRFEGRNATASNLAINGSLQYNVDPFIFQVSGYYGGTLGVASTLTDSLHLSSGPFGTPVAIGEADVQYSSHGFQFKILGTFISIPDAGAINRAFANNTPERAYGAYVEAGFDLLSAFRETSNQQLVAFARYEKLDLNSALPSNGIHDGALQQGHIVAGLSYLPDPGIVVKADVHFVHTGGQAQGLIVNSDPAGLPSEQNNTLINVGIGFAF